MAAAIDLTAIKALPIDERLRIVEDIWDSIADDSDRPHVDDELRAELDRRIADMEANPDDVCTWEEIVAYVRRKR
jgi:putative addiction module component (TIGR02574 family)